MDVTLGPWTAAMSVPQAMHKSLTDAMGDEAKSVVQNAPGFTPQQAPQGKPAKKGFTISGKVMSVTKQTGTTTVGATFTLWADGTFSNVAPLTGSASAQGSNTAEDALRGIVDLYIPKFLRAIQSGQAAKAR